jgi:hypothetical protein
VTYMNDDKPCTPPPAPPPMDIIINVRMKMLDDVNVRYKEHLVAFGSRQSNVRNVVANQDTMH